MNTLATDFCEYLVLHYPLACQLFDVREHLGTIVCRGVVCAEVWKMESQNGYNFARRIPNGRTVYAKDIPGILHGCLFFNQFKKVEELLRSGRWHEVYELYSCYEQEYVREILRRQ